MIIRERGVVFVHIPKTAGASIEQALLPGQRSPDDPPDHEHGWGWCPDRRMWLQHATLEEMLDTDLLTRTELDEFFVFAVVRNPFDRSVSDYFFLRRKTRRAGSFGEMLEATGSWDRLLRDRSSPQYRGDHVRSQIEYVTVDGVVAADHVGRFEDLNATYELLRDRGLVSADLPFVNRGAFRGDHYSHFYRNDEISQVARRYAADIAEFGYEFEDRRSEIPTWRRELTRMRALLAASTAGLKPA